MPIPVAPIQCSTPVSLRSRSRISPACPGPFTRFERLCRPKSNETFYLRMEIRISLRISPYRPSALRSRDIFGA